MCPESVKDGTVVAGVPRYGVLGEILAVVLIRPVMTKIMKKVLKGLADHTSTGKLVGKGGVLL